MSTQAVFERAVKHHLPTAFISYLERIDEFQLGQVLTYHSKPHWWKRKEVDYAGVPTVDLDLDLDAEVKSAWLSLGGKLGGSGKKNVTLSVSLGALTHIRANMFDVLYRKGYTVDKNHPVIKEAVAKGGVLFVISSIYVSDKVEVTIKEQESMKANVKEDEGTDASAGDKGKDTSTSDKESGVEKEATNIIKDVTKAAVGAAKPDEDETATGDADVSTTGLTISKRDKASVIGFHVMKIDITKTGELVPTAESGFSHHHKIHFPFADTFTATPKEGGASKPSDDKEGTTTGKTDDKGGDKEPTKEEATPDNK
ncbi:PREDICTED: uncharacterized protein LOC100633190 [Amphimedon queenslandica]|uniref:Uncharacterized protein n=1 Tax=Amphimedon queenslandica TaxID=400682 RepID=A0A1X7TSR9_AMPQE|nr:PREDICTED: uncharacterized protein LOC100633190 [Amphimedon queenslandica]|eukprot:XP_019857900.1 PREDICTED: uncharacterized protein LOC100633190 [Amphimedon queenslandica]